MPFSQLTYWWREIFEKRIVFMVRSLKEPVLEGEVVRFLQVSAKFAIFNEITLLTKVLKEKR